MFQVRQLTNEDYDLITPWYHFFKFPQPARECLPNNGLGGIMIQKEGINICCGYLYATNSALFYIEFIVSNPEYKEKDRKQAISHLIRCLTEIALDKGYKIGFTSVKNENLINRFKEAGFLEGSKNTTEMYFTE